MIQKTIETFINENYCKAPKRNYLTNNKTDVYHIDDKWSLDILVLKDYGPENSRGYRYVLVIIDNSSNFGWTIPLKNRSAPKIKDTFENILINSKRKSKLIETERGKEFFNNTVQNLLNKKNNKHYSRNTSVGAVFAERFNKTIKNLPKRLAFEKRDGKWIDILPTITKQYNNRRHSSTKLTPIQPSLKRNEGYIYNSLFDKRKNITPRFQVKDLLRTFDLKKLFQKVMKQIVLIDCIKLQKK